MHPNFSAFLCWHRLTCYQAPCIVSRLLCHVLSLPCPGDCDSNRHLSCIQIELWLETAHLFTWKFNIRSIGLSLELKLAECSKFGDPFMTLALMHVFGGVPGTCPTSGRFTGAPTSRSCARRQCGSFCRSPGASCAPCTRPTALPAACLVT